MSSIEAKLGLFETDFTAQLIRADGTRGPMVYNIGFLRAADIEKRLDIGQIEKCWRWMRRKGLIPFGVGLTAFVAWYLFGAGDAMYGLVTVGAADYMAKDFLASNSAHISAFNYHDAGVSTTAPQSSDSGLLSPVAGLSRVSGTQSSPGPAQYRTTALIAFSAPIQASEWGLFDQVSGGVLFDRRTYTPLNVGEGDAIQFTYNLTVPSGGA